MAEIAKVELSVDGELKLDGRRISSARQCANAWRLWEYSWHNTSERAGKQTLIARATDSHGRSRTDRTRS